MIVRFYSTKSGKTYQVRELTSASENPLTYHEEVIAELTEELEELRELNNLHIGGFYDNS